MCNLCINWQTLTGMARSAILKELETCDFDTTRPVVPLCTFYCVEMYYYIIGLIRLSCGDLANLSNKSELLSVYSMK